MQRSDERDEPGLGPLTGANAESGPAPKIATNALRERIRRASVAAQAPDLAPLELPSAPPPMSSSLPPEHSGVRDRPNEPAASGTMPPPVFLPPPANRSPSAAWPFTSNAGTPTRRASQSTQVGLGGPPSSAPVASRPQPPPLGPTKPRSHTPPLPSPALKDPAALIVPELRDTVPPPPAAARARALPPSAARQTPSSSPGAYHVTEESSESASGWTPEAAPASRAGAGLMRNASVASDAGRYSAQDLSVEYVDAAEVVRDPGSTPAEVVEADPSTNNADGEVVNDDPLSRARRFTPKQRPAHRRGRQHETLRTPPSRVKEDRAELLRTLPDRSRHITAPSRLSALRGSQPPSAADEGESVAVNPAIASPGASSVPSAPPAATASPTPSANTNPRRPAAITEPLASLDPGMPLQTPPTNPRLAPLARRGSSNRVNSNAITQRLPERANYQPLPKDRAGFEAFMKQRAVEAQAASRAASSSGRVHWKDQETLLIQRSSLMQTLPSARIGRRRIPLLPIVALCALVLVGGVTLFLRRQAAEPATVHAVPITSAPATTQLARVPTTLIATEPSGAELVLGGAVLGNTPVAVARPTSGEETYVLRMTGFEWQLVRVSAQSGEAIRVTMMPLGQSPPPSAAP